MIEQIYKLTTIHQFQYIFPTRYLYTYTLSRRYIYLTPKHCKALRSCFELKGTANNMSKDLVQGSRKRILLTLWVAFYLCMLSFAARAQVDEGVVTGTVVDQHGAMIPNANVTVTDLGIALKLETPKPAQLRTNIPLTRFQKMI